MKWWWAMMIMMNDDEWWILSRRTNDGLRPEKEEMQMGKAVSGANRIANVWRIPRCVAQDMHGPMLLLASGAKPWQADVSWSNRNRHDLCHAVDCYAKLQRYCVWYRLVIMYVITFIIIHIYTHMYIHSNIYQHISTEWFQIRVILPTRDGSCFLAQGLWNGCQRCCASWWWLAVGFSMVFLTRRFVGIYWKIYEDVGCSDSDVSFGMCWNIPA